MFRCRFGTAAAALVYPTMAPGLPRVVFVLLTEPPTPIMLARLAGAGGSDGR